MKRQLSTLLPALLIFLMFIPSLQARSLAQGVSLSPEATFSVSEDLLNAFLESMFANLKAPSVPLVLTPADKDRSAADSYGCSSVLSLQPEEGGVKTSVKLEQGKISAPLAFAGSYNSTLLGCIQFRGWTNTSWVLEFDRTRQAMLARVQVQDIHLTDVPGLASAPLVKLVQSAIDTRINPLELFKLEQLSGRLPLPPLNGALRLRAKEVRPEIVPGNLHLHVVYEFLPDR